MTLFFWTGTSAWIPAVSGMKRRNAMAQKKRFSRQRTYYDEYPDYTRPTLEIPRRLRDRVLGRLEFLYGPKGAENWMPEIERILKVHHAHKPPEMLEKEKNSDPALRFCQDHIILITYGDMVKGEVPTPLSALHRFVTICGPRYVWTTFSPAGNIGRGEMFYTLRFCLSGGSGLRECTTRKRHSIRCRKLTGKRNTTAKPAKQERRPP